MRKVFSVFRRDLKIAAKDPLVLWIFFAPVLLAILVNLVSPGVNDSSVNFAVNKNAGEDYIEAVREYASVEVFDSRKEIEQRVEGRDEVIGVTEEDGEMFLIAQGNESEQSLKMAQIIHALYHLDLLNAEEIESRLSYYSFHETIPGLKRTLAVTILLMTTIVSAMVIALGLVDEKNDHTIRAANVTPMNQTAYALSKCVIGIVLLFVTEGINLLVLGLTDINYGQMICMIFAVSLISILVSFTIGLSSTDFIEAAASIKMLMIPLAAGILVYEFLKEKWHFTVYWNPFYWAEKGMTEIINKTAVWSDILLYTGIITVLCGLAFMVCKKNIKKHLN